MSVDPREADMLEVSHLLPYLDEVYREGDRQIGYALGHAAGLQLRGRLAALAFIGGLLLGATLELLVTALAMR